MRRTTWWRRLAAAATLAGCFGAMAAAGASAGVVTVGSSLTGLSGPAPFGAAATITNRLLGGGGANVTSPVTGTVVRWRIIEASGGPFRLRVLAPGLGGAYTGLGTSAPATPTDKGLQVFPTSLPIKAGQTIGLNNNGAGDEVGVAFKADSAYAKWEPPLADGQALAPTYLSPEGIELAFNADVQPLPAVTLLSPTSGSISGGMTVGIAGTDFTEVKAVEFGSVPATSFSVGSEGLVSAVAPAAATPGPVDITVTTIAGRSAVVPADLFTFEACVVPRLKHKKLKAVRKALRKAGCKLGKVKHDAGGKDGKVTRQNSKPGEKRPPGTKINVELG